MVAAAKRCDRPRRRTGKSVVPMQRGEVRSMCEFSPCIHIVQGGGDLDIDISCQISSVGTSSHCARPWLCGPPWPAGRWRSQQTGARAQQRGETQRQKLKVRDTDRCKIPPPTPDKPSHLAHSQSPCARPGTAFSSSLRNAIVLGLGSRNGQRAVAAADQRQENRGGHQVKKGWDGTE